MKNQGIRTFPTVKYAHNPQKKSLQTYILEGCKLLSEKHGVFEFEVDLSCLPIKVLLERLSHVDGIMDVEIRKAPIEQVITQLYQAWKNT